MLLLNSNGKSYIGCPTAASDVSLSDPQESKSPDDSDFEGSYIIGAKLGHMSLLNTNRK